MAILHWKKWKEEYWNSSTLLLVLGVALTGTTAIVTHSLVAKNERTMASARSEAAMVERRIDELWDENTALERKSDVGILLVRLTQETRAVRGKEKEQTLVALSRYLRATFRTVQDNTDQELPSIEDMLMQHPNDPAWLNALFTVIDHKKANVIEAIDTLYLEKIELDDTLNRLTTANSNLNDLALFLQMLGMISALASRTGAKLPLIDH